uniref:Ribonuclease A-domain domain-containing protein n=1 Tax=Gopherus evgoodei TaxID=1825980 RepID=A0A8C4Y7X8_9SAUR
MSGCRSHGANRSPPHYPSFHFLPTASQQQRYHGPEGTPPNTAASLTRYEKFLRQHIDYPRTAAPDTRARNDRSYCNLMMQRRGMARPCKHTNTFVHAPASQLRDICGRAGRPAGRNLRNSNNRYRITICRLASGSTRPPCNYRGGSSTRRIRVACVRGLPVHYDRNL